MSRRDYGSEIYAKSKTGSLIFLLIYLVFGLYLINLKFTFVKIPDAITALNEWIFAIAGVLIILGGINYLRASSK